MGRGGERDAVKVVVAKEGGEIFPKMKKCRKIAFFTEFLDVRVKDKLKLLAQEQKKKKEKR